MNLSFEKSYGAILGLAYGDAIAFPALFHRTHQFLEKRREFLWRTNRDSARNRILRLTMPFTHRNAPETLEPFPTDDTEYAVFTAQTLIAAREISADTFARAWRERIVPLADQVLTGFSERAAIENFRRGLEPPATGNDNPQHYDDSAVARAVPIGLFCASGQGRAAQVAQLDAQVTNAEDGIYAARAMAVAIALLASGANIGDALARARQEFPADSWIARGDAIARECVRDANATQDLLLALTNRLINTCTRTAMPRRKPCLPRLRLSRCVAAIYRARCSSRTRFQNRRTRCPRWSARCAARIKARTRSEKRGACS